MKLLPFDFKIIDNKFLLINDSGEFIFLNESNFQNLIGYKKLNQNLKNKFWFDPKDNLHPLIRKYQRSKIYLNRGTTLFILVLTNRCNLNCVYCQANKKISSSSYYDMSMGTAKSAVDFIFQSPSKNVVIEFQGGEPLINFEVLKFIVKYVREYQKLFDKTIEMNLVSNLVSLDEKKLQFLIQNKVNICTSLDGNKVVHDYNRPGLSGGSYECLINKLKLINKVSYSLRLKTKINAIQTTTRISFNFFKEIIDTYVSLGFNSIFLRPINPFGKAIVNKEKIGYSPYEYLDFYNRSLKYILDLNKSGHPFIENTARIFLKKIMRADDGSYVDLRSPCGATIGQLAINYDGCLYTCDEGRILSEMGDRTFKIGAVETSTYEDTIKNLVTKTACLASCSECSQRCYQCVYRPYCGTCPVINYVTEKDIFKNSSYRCIINEGILDTIFKTIKNKEVNTIFNRWVEG